MNKISLLVKIKTLSSQKITECIQDIIINQVLDNNIRRKNSRRVEFKDNSPVLIAEDFAALDEPENINRTKGNIYEKRYTI